MMQKASSSYRIAGGWLLLVLLVAIFTYSKGADFDSSIIALLPKSQQQPVVQQATDKMAERFSRRLIVMLSGEDEGKVRNAIKTLADSLMMKPSVSDVIWRIEEDELTRFYDEQYPYRFSVIEQGVRERLLAGDFEQIKQQALIRVFSPLSIGGGIIEDPFGLLISLSQNQKSDLNLELSDALLKVTDTELPTYILMVELSTEPYSPHLQREILGTFETQELLLSDSGISIHMSGMLIHAAAGARQASNEISTIGIGSLLGIMIAMLLVFRQFKPLLLMLFSITLGCISAAAVTMLVFDRVHLITFAFGAGLVGVSVDYALHYLCESRSPSGGDTLRKILPGLLLGLFSSLMAYSAQALTPFPGLQQMAVFSVVGLSAAWLTVVLWFPLLTRAGDGQSLMVANKLDQIRRLYPRVENSRIVIALLAIIFVLAVKSLWGSSARDDVRLLQTSPDSLLAQEQVVQKTLGISSSSQFLLITGDSLERCLQTEESLMSGLEGLKIDGLLEGYQALSMVLPSLQRQAENSRLVRELYDKQLASFYDALNVSDKKLEIARHVFEQEHNAFLTSDSWLQSRASERWKDMIVMQTDQRVATVIRLTGRLDKAVKQELMTLSAAVTGVTYVDKIQDISTLIATYRSQIIELIVMAYLCVLIVLMYRYKKQTWRVVLPTLFASVVTLAILAQVEQGINLFHLMALLLVLGIGLDMGIFLIETDGAPHTWLAVSLSAYTSLLAFGMLALSDTPVLHHFGLTVLIGLTIVWLVTPLMRNNNLQDITL